MHPILVIALVVLGVIAALILGILLLAMTKPNELRVQRSTSIYAPPAKIFPLIDDFHCWTVWSPYEKRDPELKRTYSGAPKGKGAIYEWNGNSNVGQGRMEIMESTPSSKISIKLDFIKPFEGHNVAEFTFVPQGNATNVTWLMHGPASFMTKVMSTIMNMDKMIGKDFEDGLATLKSVTEK